jgi:DNA-binding NarL/FixJ family response regulator
MMTSETTVIVADNYELIREGVAAKLAGEFGYSVIAKTSDGNETINACTELSPDILVMGMCFTVPTGLEVFQQVRSRTPDVSVVILAEESTPSEAFMLISGGAIAFVPRDARVVDLVNAVRAAELGYSSVPCEYIAEFTVLQRNVMRTGNLYGLSSREVEVINATVAGETAKEIAECLEISIRTVEAHRNSIYKKTGYKALEQLTEIASTMKYWGAGDRRCDITHCAHA